MNKSTMRGAARMAKRAIDMTAKPLLQLVTPLPCGPCEIVSLAGADAINDLSEHRLEFRLPVPEQNPPMLAKRLLDTPVVVAVTSAAGERFVAGVIDELECDARGEVWTAIIRPRLSALSERRNVRSFTGRNVLDVVKVILNDHRLAGTLQTHFAPGAQPSIREFVQQVGETDLEFVRRLWEEEGWSFYFVSGPGGDQLHLTDGVDLWLDLPGEPIQERRGSNARAKSDVIMTWRWLWRRTSSGTSVGAYDFTRVEPRLAKAAGGRGTIPSSRQAEGKCLDADGLQRIARLNSRRDDAKAATIHGSGDVRAFSPGHIFTRAANGSRFLLTRVRIDAQQLPGPSFRCWFEAVPAGGGSAPFCPPISTASPRLTGVFPAEIVEVADKHDRVRLRLAWQQEGESTGWCGTVHPANSRMRYDKDQRVLVAFLDGHPDLPMVLGQIGHAGAKDFDPSSEPEISGIHTVGHDLLFDDTLGQESVGIHSGGSVSQTAKGDWHHAVGGNSVSTVSGSEDLSVERDARTQVGGSWMQHVMKNAQMTADGKLELRGKSVVIGSKDSYILASDKGLFFVGNILHFKPPGMKAPSVGGPLKVSRPKGRPKRNS